MGQYFVSQVHGVSLHTILLLGLFKDNLQRQCQYGYQIDIIIISLSCHSKATGMFKKLIKDWLS